VIATTHNLELLLEGGFKAADTAVRKGIDFLYSSLQRDIVSTGNKTMNQVVAHDMFSAQDRDAEFRSAVAYKKEWNPVGLCYKHIPNIQNSYALRLLNSAGHDRDPRVVRACENLVALYRNYGGFCETNIRVTLTGE